LFALIASAVTAYSLLFKSEWSTSALKFSSAIFASFLLWFIFDFFYYSKLPKEFDVLSFSFKEPAHSQFTDFEEMRFSLFKKWHQLLGGKEADLSELQSNGLFRPIPLGIRFCQNSHCDFFNLEESIPVKPTGVKRVFDVNYANLINWETT
jgi:hypothetical protein